MFMKKEGVIVLVLVLAIAALALFVLVRDNSMTGGVPVCDSYAKGWCTYGPMDTCCFKIYYTNGDMAETCYASYKFAWKTYQEMTKQSGKSISGIDFVSGITEGPFCIH